MPIRCNCPHCRQGVKVPSRMAGHVVHCPACGSGMTVPAAAPTSFAVAAQATPSYVAACPGCARRIPLDAGGLPHAIQCAVCATVFSPATGQPVAAFAVVQQSEPIVRARSDKGGPGLGIAALCCGATGFFLAMPLLAILLKLNLPVPAMVVFGWASVCLAFVIVPIQLVAVVLGFVGSGRRRGSGVALLGLLLGAAGVVIESWFWLVSLR